jgi:cytoskeletal protein CcmA (bactofilin family)
MFKKNNRGQSDSSSTSIQDSEIVSPLQNSISAPFTQLDNYLTKFSAIENRNESQDLPELHIGEHVRIEGILSFDKLARIDGFFAGEVLSKGKIIIGPQATVKADLFLDEAHIEGTLEGNITVHTKLILRGHAKVIGDIVAPSISVHEEVTIRGQLHVSKITDPSEEEEELPFVTEPL